MCIAIRTQVYIATKEPKPQTFGSQYLSLFGVKWVKDSLARILDFRETIWNILLSFEPSLTLVCNKWSLSSEGGWVV